MAPHSEKLDIHTGNEKETETKVNEILKKIVQHHKDNPHADFSMQGHFQTGEAIRR